MSKERYKELKNKGWQNLNKDERVEYSNFKNSYDGADANMPKPTVSQPKENTEEKISLSKSELSKLLEDVAEKAVREQYMSKDKDGNKKLYGKFGEWSEVDEADNALQTATFKLWQESADQEKGLIIKADYLKDEWNEEEHKFNKIVYRIELLYTDGKTETKDVDLRQLVKISDVEKVKIVKNDRKKMVKTDGTVIVTPKNKDNYQVRRVDFNPMGDSSGGFEVPLTVERYEEVFTLKRDNGQEFQAEAKYLNM
jgi:hypothetical protein